MNTINEAFVIAVHDEILKQTLVGRVGVHLDRLESVLGRISQQIYYNQIDNIFEIAAWYGIALAKGHAFVDGNKRTALAVMLTFLEIQGIDIQYNSGLDDLMVDIVESQQDHVVLANLVAEFLCELQTKDFY